MSNGWFTTEDILNDLTEVTGRRVTSIDDSFAVRGERPPPVNMAGEEDQYIHMYDQYTNQSGEMMEPDLRGIKHMLRMVNDYYDSATYDDDKHIRELQNAANTVFCVGKLNQNVKKFKPRNIKRRKNNFLDDGKSVKSASSDCLSNKESSSKDVKHMNLNCKNDVNMSKTDSTHNENENNEPTESSCKTKENINDIDFTKKIDVANLDPKDIENIRERLKLKIVITSKAECSNKKRERNLAMASLPKLYTDIPKSKNKSQPLKLMTPEYFQTTTASYPQTKETEQCTGKEDKDKIKITLGKDKQHERNTINPVNVLPPSSRTTSQETSDVSSNKSTEDNLETQNDFITSKELQESFKKVEKWLNGPEKIKHKPRAFYLGPVTFKRKETASATRSDTTSVTNIETTAERPSSVHTSDSFVPSSYADELTKMYMERNQFMVNPYEDMWTKLERQLKDKEVAMKLRLSSP